jgi:plasmid stability protein
MPTLYVENVPEDLYEALRAQAQEHRKSITAEVLTLLAENVPTATEMARRKQLLARARKLRSKRPVSDGEFPSAEEMQREDRGR